MNPIKAFGYSATEKVLRALLSIVFIALIGRFLTPSELGIFAVIWAVYQLLQSFFGSALVNAYLRSDKSFEISQVLFGASTVMGFLGAMAFLILIPFVESIFSISFTLFGYLIISSILFLMPINSFLKGILQGEAHFDRIALVEIISLLISIIVTIYLLLNNYGILSLCFKYLTESLCVFIAYFLVFKIRPGFKLSLSSNKVRNLFKYSLGLSVSRFFSSLASNFSTLFIGYIFAIKYVAFFSYSMTLTKIPDSLFRTMITNPALTYLGNHKGDMLFEK